MKKRILFLTGLLMFFFFASAQTAKKSLVTDAMANKVAYWVDAPNGGIMEWFYDANGITSVIEGEKITKNILQHKDCVEKFIIKIIGTFGESTSWITFEDLGYTIHEYDLAKQIYANRPISKADDVKDNENSQQTKEQLEPATEPVVVEPTFNGDSKKWISKHIKYPQLALEENIQGNVSVEFFVEADGSISRVKAIRSPHPILSKEAERIVKSMPKWRPGTKDGVPSAFKMNTVIPFKL